MFYAFRILSVFECNVLSPRSIQYPNKSRAHKHENQRTPQMRRNGGKLNVRVAIVCGNGKITAPQQQRISTHKSQKYTENRGAQHTILTHLPVIVRYS